MASHLNFGPFTASCMVPITYSDAVTQIIADIPSKEEYVSKEDAWINGIVKPDASSGNIGPHLTLQSGVVTIFVERAYDVTTPDEIAAKMMSIISPDDTCDVMLDIKTIKCMPKIAKDGTHYMCVVFVVDVPKPIHNVRNVLFANFPSVTYYPDWKAHVTVGYFYEDHHMDIVKRLFACIGMSIYCGQCVVDVKPSMSQ